MKEYIYILYSGARHVGGTERALHLQVSDPGEILWAEHPIFNSLGSGNKSEVPLVVGAAMVKYGQAAAKPPGDRLARLAWGVQDGASSHEEVEKENHSTQPPGTVAWRMVLHWVRRVLCLQGIGWDPGGSDWIRILGCTVWAGGERESCILKQIMAAIHLCQSILTDHIKRSEVKILLFEAGCTEGRVDGCRWTAYWYSEELSDPWKLQLRFLKRPFLNILWKWQIWWTVCTTY